MDNKTFRHIISGLLIWVFLLSQISCPAAQADLKNLSEVSTLAPPSIFKPFSPDEHSERLKRAFILKKELLSIAFDLYASIFTDKDNASVCDYLRRIPRRAKESQSFAEELLKFDFSNIRSDIKRKVLYIPYGNDLEVRVYIIAEFPEGAPLVNGEKLIERGSSASYALDVVTAPATYENLGDKIAGAAPVWRDEMARLASSHEAGIYNYVSEKEREALNREKVYREIFEKSILPKLRKAREANLRKGAPSVLTIGITGSAASGKTTIAGNFRKELLKEFSNVRMILFDDWLLQASDRPIDPDTKKTTEDVFKKFEVTSFVKSIKAFIRGADLLKPVYHQTAKGTLKLTLDDKGLPVILFGPKRSIVVIDSPAGPALSVRDEKGKVLEEAAFVTQFDIRFSVAKGSMNGEVLLTILNTRIKIGALKDGKRSVRIIDDKGNDARDMIDPGTGELIAESGAIITMGGYIGPDGALIDKPWKIKERIPHEDGVFIVEGILSLYDDPGLPAAEQLAKLYTTSMFIDADFEVRIERGFTRERSRAEALKGQPMASEDSQKYIDLFTQRKEKLEDPFIYATRDSAEYVGTTETRAEGIFSLYRNGLLLSQDFRRAVSKTGIDPTLLDEELGRIEEDFILSEIRKSAANGELRFESKAEGPMYNVYFLKNGIILKVPKYGTNTPNMDLLRSKGGDVAVPTSFVDLSKLKIKIEGKESSCVIAQNRVALFDKILSEASVRQAQGLLDLFFGLQKKMWALGIVDKALSLDRYGSMIVNTGRPAVLLRRISDIGNRGDEFDAAGLWAISQTIRPDIKTYFTEKARELIEYTGKERFGSAKSWKALPKIYNPALSTLQINYIASLILEYKTVQLWRLFKRIKLPLGVSAETIWTRLWMDTIAKQTSGARDAINVFYRELLADPDIVKDKKPHELRDYIFRLAPPLGRQDKVQINKYLVYLCRIPLKMVGIGEGTGETASTLRIKPQIYDRIDPADKKDLCRILSNPDPEKLNDIIRSSGGRFAVAFADQILGEGRTIYMALRSPVNVDGKTLGSLRIKGARPIVEGAEGNVKEYKGRGSVNHVMESYASGAVLVKPGRPGPWGTMLYSDALTEYELMERFNGSECRTDIPVGVGRYRSIKYKNTPAGYVICGMDVDDSRLEFITGSGRTDIVPGRIALMNMVTGSASNIDSVLPAIYEEIGRTLRYFHDKGYSHRWPHIGNIGLSMDETGRPRVVLRDLNSAQDMSADSASERIADRFLDVSRVLYDVLKDRQYETEFDGDVETEKTSFPRLAKSFIEGYFRELTPESAEFNSLIDVMRNGFVSQLENLVGDKRSTDYEELNEKSRYFGSIIAELRKIEEENSQRIAKDVSAPKSPKAAWPVLVLPLPGEEPVRAAELSMQAIHEAHRIFAPAAIDKGRMVFHIIDPLLIPEEQERLVTQINKLTRDDGFKEKVIVGKVGEPLEDTIGNILREYPDAIIDVAVRDAAIQAELEKINILSLVFKPEPGDCNFRQLEGIIAALRAVQRNDRDALLKIYTILTGNTITESMPEDIRDLIKKLIFTLPALEIKDSSELKRLNENLLKFIQSA